MSQMGSNQPHQQPVVQSIFESLTRCFNPIDANEFPQSSNTSVDPNSRQGVARTSVDEIISRRSKLSSSPTRASERLELKGAEWDDVFNGGHSRKTSRSADSRRSKHSRKPSRGKDSGSDNEYDAVAQAKKAAHRLDPETLHQKSMKRKLEIFRSRDSDEQDRPDKAQSSNPPSRQSSHCGSKRGSKANVAFDTAMGTAEDLVLSDSDDEIANLTSRKRFACGMNVGGHRSSSDGPISSFAKFFNIGQNANPFGLCFATPVRTSSPENIAKLSDDKLTADEFIKKYGGNPMDTPELETSVDSSSLSEGASRGEDDTITSTLYFDQKYSHVVQTRPPMPLFHSQIVPCSESQSDGLTNMIKRKQQSESQRRQYSGVTVTPSPKRNIFARTSPESPANYVMNDPPPSPLRVKSSSVSTQSADSSPSTPYGIRHLREPDILHSTAAEI